MKKSLIIMLLLFSLMSSSIYLFAQNREVFKLSGYIGVQGGESFNYNLELKDSTANFMTGHAFTFSNPNNDVQATVLATLDKNAKTLYIIERTILQNRGFKSKAVICLVECLLTYDEQSKSLSGSLITRTSNNGLACGKGSLSFGKVKEIEHLFSERTVLEESNTAAVKIVESPKLNPTKKLNEHFREQQRQEALAKRQEIRKKQINEQEKQPIKITAGKAGAYLWNSDKIILNIWDGGIIDNDKVSIFYNGDLILENYTLTKEKKEIILPVGGNELNIISIVAVNEGNEPPSTADISIEDNGKIYFIVAHNKVGKNALIKIKKNKEL